MTDIESKLKELGYTMVHYDKYCKSCNSERLYLRVPSDVSLREEWFDYLEAVLGSYNNGDKQLYGLITCHGTNDPIYYICKNCHKGFVVEKGER